MMVCVLALFLLLPPVSLGSDQVLYFVAFRGGAYPYEDCSRSVKNHERGAGRVPICLSGNGKYRMDSIQRIAAEDWFPAARGPSAGVGEVRVRCSDNPSEVIPRAMVFFPNESELARNEGGRIELSCRSSPEEVRDDLLAAAELFHLSIQNANRAVGRTEQVIATCDSVPPDPECRVWRSHVSRVLSGQAAARLLSPARFCSVPFVGGLAPWVPPNPPPPDIEEPVPPEWAAIDLRSPVRMIDSSIIVRQSMPSCVDTRKVGAFERCLRESRRLRAYLASRGAVFQPDGNALFGRDSISPRLDITSETLMGSAVIDSLLRLENTAGLLKQGGLMPNPIGLTETQADWDRALSATIYQPGIELHDDGALGNHRSPLRYCGLDPQCHHLVDAILDRFAPHLDEIKGCRKLLSVSIDSKRVLHPVFGPCSR